MLLFSVDSSSSCPKGKTKKDGACVPCAVGFYKSAEGDGACTKCPTGRSTINAGSPSVAHCSKSKCDEKEIEDF